MKSKSKPATKPIPKLALNRETLRRLEKGQLEEAQGGAPAGFATTEEWSSCPPCGDN